MLQRLRKQKDFQNAIGWKNIIRLRNLVRFSHIAGFQIQILITLLEARPTLLTVTSTFNCEESAHVQNNKRISSALRSRSIALPACSCKRPHARLKRARVRTRQFEAASASSCVARARETTTVVVWPQQQRAATASSLGTCATALWIGRCGLKSRSDGLFQSVAYETLTVEERPKYFHTKKSKKLLTFEVFVK